MATRQFGQGSGKNQHSALVRSRGERPGRAASGAGRGKNKRKPDSAPSPYAYGVRVPNGLHEAIEAERGNLAKAESVLGCLAISMEADADITTGPYYPDVAEVARDLVRKSINGLDSLTLQQCLLRNKVKEGSESRVVRVVGYRTDAVEYAMRNYSIGYACLLPAA
jgi:hypothetical protein